MPTAIIMAIDHLLVEVTGQQLVMLKTVNRQCQQTIDRECKQTFDRECKQTIDRKCEQTIDW